MIACLQGKIILKKDKFIILDVNGVGYKVFVSEKTLSGLPETGGSVKVFCFLNVRENALDLYGFLDEKELEFFEILENIRGVGPKAALKIASFGPLEKIKERIMSRDEKLFEKVPGIGRKKAMTIILELTGKIKNIPKGEKAAEVNDAEEGLINLGFSRQRAKYALSKIPENIKGVEQKIKEALKILGR
jgi:Holliday junction DNA helicase RuvA